MINPAVLAQINQLMPGGSGSRRGGAGSPISMGPGGMGGGAQADFDSLDRPDHHHRQARRPGTKSADRARFAEFATT